MAPDPAPDPDIEHDLGRLLADSVQGLRPPVAVMVAEATRHGRVLRRRRRLATAASAAAVLALAVTVTLTALPALAGSDAAPAGPTSSGATAAAAPELRARQTAAMRTELTRLTGPGVRLESEPGADQLTLDPAADSVLWTRYDDGRGAVTLSVEVHGPASKAAGPSCAERADAARAAGYRCETAPGPGPEPQVVEVLTTADSGWLTYRIWTPFPDGTRVGLAVHNGTLHEADDPSLNSRRTRDAPPLDLPRWQRIAADAAWARLPGLAPRS
ncbi:hypothetical protein ACFCX4_25275 [Kitasatospora sp. NPDC056327]|uniref:hypothetical protein n=1 Tax=Kitasatospora sp. NPDC056327 TaxID=3345785 RepID=UPI0035DAE254